MRRFWTAGVALAAVFATCAACSAGAASGGRASPAGRSSATTAGASAAGAPSSPAATSSAAATAAPETTTAPTGTTPTSTTTQASPARLRAGLPIAAQLGPGWGAASEQDFSAEGMTVFAYALAHCKPVAAYASGNGALDGPQPDPGYVSLVHRLAWTALSNDPDLQVTPGTQEQAVAAYDQADSGPGGTTFSSAVASLDGCKDTVLHGITVAPTPARVARPSGVAHFAAFDYRFGGSRPAELGTVEALDADGVIEIINVTDGGSDARTPADAVAERTLAHDAAVAAAQRLSA